MELKKKLKMFSDKKVILSIIGGAFISLGMPALGFAIWVYSNWLWLVHFKQKEDQVAYDMYLVWQLQAIVGVIYWGFIV